MSRWLDHLERRQKHWRAGLPWSRFSIPGMGFGAMLMLAAVWYPDTTPWSSLGGAVLMAVGVYCLFMEQRTRARRKAHRASGLQERGA
jgi:uncharacterized membrane protein YfcA